MVWVELILEKVLKTFLLSLSFLKKFFFISISDFFEGRGRELHLRR